MDVLLWGVLPYVTLLLLIGGTIWRYRYDKFGWTTRSSELYESRLLRIGSPIFHFGILVVIVGHAMGLVIPESWTEAIGVSEHLYHIVAAGFGLLAGVLTLGGLAILIYRRRTSGPVFMATTTNDKVMYVVLTAALVLGVYITLIGTVPGATGVNYRETVSPWFRSIFLLRPDIDAMSAAPARFHIHVLVGMLVFAMVPFTRLVHAFTAPVHYLFRPYIVYRSRDAVPTDGSRPTRRGWAPVGTRDRQR
ncbi:respiratory nitrate reductase, gamma subunit [Gordonia bronchialis DSM 43247]|uniref:Nitrate reductase-like protein NarX n=1 Tax=Gordonia bronchialis (strain ATCC 25592 / DSM 43247 / BCRC 13721 / JCM 3198 / KCTC 3076 / NBRC 16047 / NCTC 10667) TaxID=526226 RepID=D0L2I3_GORB4|nr:respiratory nitrate reductase subunit gamma [Gordonia bronchialis]ACY22886.1 respiratory nitrate reductase, gamma subunit [Gordonia bronchialis DSM 43247]MCC3325665.1 respiratory nitrate reductase subunit gamma [Gordonia bronchialis]QGS23675.1 respiratory nitrate reductase subunit gamma [Gordonia bronchialis]UAK40150.1 respiratory nitrate reductase subunit gamma [Gordonia bronchialis]STQ65833.1 Nitrate reductase-like protein narX [Gordonia bronchialis]